MNKLMLGGVATAAIVIAAAAIAQPPATPVAATPPSAPQPRVEIMRVERGPMRTHTREDVVKHVRELFGRLDTNRDGFIARDEADIVKMAMGEDIRGRFAERLAERDGPRPDRGAAFDRLDTNKDGMVSRDEFMSAKPRIEEHRMIVMREGPGGEAGGAGKDAHAPHGHGTARPAVRHGRRQPRRKGVASGSDRRGASPFRHGRRQPRRKNHS